MGKKIVTIYEAKTNLSKLIQEVTEGKEVIIAKGKIPIVKLTLLPSNKKRKIGNFKDQIEMTENFDDELDDFKEYMEK